MSRLVTWSALPVAVVGLASVVDVAVAGTNSCALAAAGTVSCWGSGHTTPVVVAGLQDATAIDMNSSTVCAILADQTVSCAGLFGSASPVAGITGATAIDSSGSHFCVVADGAVKCWGGTNAYGEYGDGSITNAIDVAAGVSHTCAVLADHTVTCWGLNSLGQLGDGSTTDSTAPVAVGDVSDAVAVAANGNSTCATLADGGAACWGQMTGDATVPSSLSAVRVGGLEGVVQISGGGSGTGGMCARDAGGDLACWGSNTLGQLGDGAKAQWSPVAVNVAGLTGITDIAVGYSHSCALASGGTVRCWGSNGGLQLGDGTSTWSLTPVTVLTTLVPVPVPLGDVTAVAAGYTHTCALRVDGTVACWGDGGGGLAVSIIAIGTSLPAAAAISAGGDGSSYQTCALLVDATVACWGSGTTTPVLVPTITGATAVAAGAGHACAVIEGGAVLCWSAGGTPATVPGLSGVTAIAAGGAQDCAVRVDGTVACWSVGGLSPTTVAGLASITSVSVGGLHACAIRADGTAWCWGSGLLGQLGNGATTISATPVLVAGVAGAVKVAAGYDSGISFGHTCAVLSGGLAQCWGGSFYGELGNGADGQRRVIQAPVHGLPGPLALGDHLACVRATDTLGNTTDGTDCVTFHVDPPDTTAPGVASFGSASASPTGAASIAYTLVADEAVTGLEAADLANAGTATGCVLTPDKDAGTSFTVTVTGCSAAGTLAPRLLAGSVADLSGNAGPAADADATTVLELDRDGPGFTAPVSLSLRSGVALASASAASTLPVTLAWGASDPQGPVAYTLERSLNGGTWTAVALASPAAVSIATTVPSAGTVAYRVTACDALANCTVSATGTLRPGLVQEASTAVRWAGTWKAYSLAALSGGSDRYATAKGASATYSFTGRSVALVVMRGPGRGYAWVYLDGSATPAAKVDLSKAATQPRYVAWQASWATSGAHTVRVWVAGTAGRPRVDVDAFAVVR